MTKKIDKVEIRGTEGDGVSSRWWDRLGALSARCAVLGAPAALVVLGLAAAVLVMAGWTQSGDLLTQVLGGAIVVAVSAAFRRPQ